MIDDRSAAKIRLELGERGQNARTFGVAICCHGSAATSNQNRELLHESHAIHVNVRVKVLERVRNGKAITFGTATGELRAVMGAIEFEMEAKICTRLFGVQRTTPANNCIERVERG